MARHDDVSFGPGLGYRIVRILIVLMTLVTLMTLAASTGWLFELTTNLRPQFSIVLIPLVLAAFLMKGWKIGLVGLAALAINLAPVLPEWTAKPPVASSEGPALRVFYANVHKENLRSDRLLETLGQQQPDVAVLLEIDARWARQLDALKGPLPHQFVEVREDNFGIAVLSKEPFLDRDLVTLVPDIDVPAVRAHLEFGQRQIELWAVHTMPPLRPELKAKRDRQLEALGLKVLGAEHPVVVAGDLNVSPWSPSFKRLLLTTGLKDTRLGFGLQATWPALMGSLGVPIDHVLVSPSIAVRDRQVGDPIGSDHRPILVVLANAAGG